MENKSLFNWVVKNNFKQADFWLINKGDKDIGKPVKEFQPFLTGIQCPAKILPDYGFYLCVHFYNLWIWHQIAIGSTNFKNLRISDIRSFFNQLSRQHRESSRYVQINKTNGKSINDTFINY
ncbi:MAG: hypothetical protein U7127_05115 [Phormidium sp.]